MFCPQCGSAVEQGAAFCTQCGAAVKVASGQAGQTQQVPVQQMQQPAQQYPGNGTTVVVNQPAAPATGGGAAYAPSSHLFLGIIATFCCGCFPLGLISLICAIVTMNRNSAGQYEAARGSSKHAALWGWIAVILGLLMWIFWLIWIFLMGGLAILQAAAEQGR